VTTTLDSSFHSASGAFIAVVLVVSPVPPVSVNLVVVFPAIYVYFSTAFSQKQKPQAPNDPATVFSAALAYGTLDASGGAKKNAPPLHRPPRSVGIGASASKRHCFIEPCVTPASSVSCQRLCRTTKRHPTHATGAL
ncbi:unnamed protein product, partial [Ixodes pacificus]